MSAARNRTRKAAPTTGAARRAVIYVRISKDRDNQSSTETQEHACRAYAERNGWTVVGVEIDQGRSAYNGKSKKRAAADRPGFKRALHAIDNGLADVLLVWALDRAVRSVRDLSDVLDRLDSVDAGFVSATQPIDTTNPMGRAMVQIIGVLAELESAIKSERMSEHHAGRRRAGAPAGGPRSLGYHRDGSGGLVIDGDEAEHVLYAFEAYLAGETMNGIARNLREAGAVSSTGKTITCQTVRDMLDNVTYAGAMVVDGVMVDAPWQAIVDRDMFERVRRLRARTVRPRAKYDRALLTGLFSCGRCGSNLRGGHRTNGRIRYTCSGERCYNGVSEIEADGLVVAATVGSLSRDRWNDMRASASGIDPTVELRAQLERLAGDYADDLITDAEWSIMRPKLVARITAAESKGVVRSELPDVDDIATAWPNLSIEQQRAVLAGLLDGPVVLGPARNRGRFESDRFAVTLVD